MALQRGSIIIRERESGLYPIATMFRVLRRHPSRYHGWRQWLPSPRARVDAELRSRIKLTHKNSTRDLRNASDSCGTSRRGDSRRTQAGSSTDG